jgi:DNA-binding IclR family transcriptional regulator
VKVRANGTKRSLSYLAPGTDERKAAEAVAARVKKGETVAAIAEDLSVSLATARRFLTNLALAHAVEAGDHDKSWSAGTKEVVVHRVAAKSAA